MFNFFVDIKVKRRYTHFGIKIKEGLHMLQAFDYSKLRGRIVEKYGNMSAFAEAAGITKVSLSLKLNNKLSITKNDIVNWSELLDISLEDMGAFYFVKKFNDV